MNKRLLLTTIGVCLIVIQTSYGQRSFRLPAKDKIEAGITIGASNYQGDLEETALNLGHTEFFYGGLIRYNFSNFFSVRFGADNGTISDRDGDATESWRIKRNLSFKTQISDGYIAPEFYFAHWNIGEKKWISPYIFAGVGVFHFNPQAEYKGTWYDLRPLGTEGQGSLEFPDRHPYDPNQIYIPFGAGLRISLSSSWFLSVECRINKTFTDYLDDVSTTYPAPSVIKSQQSDANGDLAVALSNRSVEINPRFNDFTGDPRGNPKQMDWFIFTGITISHSFRNKSHCYSF